MAVRKIGFALILLVWALPLWAHEQVRERAMAFLRGTLKGPFEVEQLEYKLDPHLNLWVVAAFLKEGERRRPVLFYLSRDLRFVIAGRVYDAEGQRELSRGHFEELLGKIPTEERRVSLEGLSLRGPVLGEGEQVVIISNPHCPHCRKLLPALIEAVRAKGGLALYYKGVLFSKDRELEEAIECVREKSPQCFWDFVHKAYTLPKEEALKWLEAQLGADFLKGCDSQKILVLLEQDDREVSQRLGVRGIPAAVYKGVLLEGTGEIRDALLGKLQGQR